MPGDARGVELASLLRVEKLLDLLQGLLQVLGGRRVRRFLGGLLGQLLLGPVLAVAVAPGLAGPLGLGVDGEGVSVMAEHEEPPARDCLRRGRSSFRAAPGAAGVGQLALPVDGRLGAQGLEVHGKRLGTDRRRPGCGGGHGAVRSRGRQPRDEVGVVVGGELAAPLVPRGAGDAFLDVGRLRRRRGADALRHLKQ